MTTLKLSLLILCISASFSFKDKSADVRQLIIQNADDMIGSKYSYKNVKGFDCSGFVQFCYRQAGIEVPRSSKTQAKGGKSINIKEAQPGDILIFKGSNTKNKLPGHSALFHHISGDTIFFIHSSIRKGVDIDHIFQPYYKKRFLECRSYF